MNPQQPLPPKPLESPQQPPAQPTAIQPAAVPPASPAPITTPLPAASSNQPSAELMQKAAANDRRRSFVHVTKSIMSLAGFVATVVIAAVVINQFVFQSYYVDGSSMTPTLQNEDRLIIDKVSKTIANVQGHVYLPKRGDVVVLDSSILDQTGHQEQLIKRVVGLPGDIVSIRDGFVTIKNSQSPQGFEVDKTLGLNLEPTYSESPIEVTVPENSIYVLGDNRGLNGSFDSRAFGPTASKNVQGRLAARIFPFDQARAF